MCQSSPRSCQIHTVTPDVAILPGFKFNQVRVFRTCNLRFHNISTEVQLLYRCVKIYQEPMPPDQAGGVIFIGCIARHKLHIKKSRRLLLYRFKIQGYRASYFHPKFELFFVGSRATLFKCRNFVETSPKFPMFAEPEVRQKFAKTSHGTSRHTRACSKPEGGWCRPGCPAHAGALVHRRRSSKYTLTPPNRPALCETRDPRGNVRTTSDGRPRNAARIFLQEVGGTQRACEPASSPQVRRRRGRCAEEPTTSNGEEGASFGAAQERAPQPGSFTVFPNRAAFLGVPGHSPGVSPPLPCLVAQLGREAYGRPCVAATTSR